MGTAPSKATKTKVQPVEPVLYYVRVGSKDVVTIDRLPTDTLFDVRCPPFPIHLSTGILSKWNLLTS